MLAWTTAFLLLANVAAHSSDPFEMAHAAITRSLLDPSSAQFRDELAFVGPKEKPEPANFTVCGEINAKNSYGGYTGFRPYFVAGSTAEIYESDEKPAGFKILWKAFCLDGPKANADRVIRPKEASR